MDQMDICNYITAQDLSVDATVACVELASQKYCIPSESIYNELIKTDCKKSDLIEKIMPNKARLHGIFNAFPSALNVREIGRSPNIADKYQDCSRALLEFQAVFEVYGVKLKPANNSLFIVDLPETYLNFIIGNKYRGLMAMNLIALSYSISNKRSDLLYEYKQELAGDSYCTSITELLHYTGNLLNSDPKAVNMLDFVTNSDISFDSSTRLVNYIQEYCYVTTI